jgi:Zn-dependent peptidase ImmA (M78 family)
MTVAAAGNDTFIVDTPHVETARIQTAVQALYELADIPPPSRSYPIAPLGPLVDSLPILCRELPALTCRTAEMYLLQRGNLTAPLPESQEKDTPLAGFLYAGVGMACVFLRKDDPVVRRRFSLAHELGHLMLHFPGALTGEADIETTEYHDYFTTQEAEAKDEETAAFAEHRLREREADTFAAELLMPANVVTAIATETAANGFSGAGLAERIAMEMLVSRAAMLHRLDALNLSPYPVSFAAYQEARRARTGHGGE